MINLKINTNLSLYHFFVIIIILITSAFANLVSAQPQRTWQWVKQLGGKSWDISSGVAADSKNIYYR